MKATLRSMRVLAVLVIAALLAAFWSPAPAQADDATWWGAYFDNRSLAGTPRWISYDPEINYNWGAGAPNAYLPVDNFSVRWTRTVYFASGVYRFVVTADDGVRFFLDGHLLIDQWRDQASTTYTVERNLGAGNHSLRLEYYENSGLAQVSLRWWRLDTPGQPAAAWRGEYYNNPWLAGAPTVVRDDSAIAFDWGTASPDYRLPADNFSARWTRAFTFDGGRYRFTTTSDDGVRLFIDDRLVLDRWQDMSRSAYSVDVQLNAGVHVIRMEYYDRYVFAVAGLSWTKLPLATVGNIVTCVRPVNSWIKIYRWENSQWVDVNARGWGAVSSSGRLKIDGMVIDGRYGYDGHPYRVELWADGRLIRSVGNTAAGEPEFRVYPLTDNRTPWGCPAP